MFAVNADITHFHTYQDLKKHGARRNKWLKSNPLTNQIMEQQLLPKARKTKTLNKKIADTNAPEIYHQKRTTARATYYEKHRIVNTIANNEQIKSIQPNKNHTEY